MDSWIIALTSFVLGQAAGILITLILTQKSKPSKPPREVDPYDIEEPMEFPHKQDDIPNFLRRQAE